MDNFSKMFKIKIFWSAIVVTTEVDGAASWETYSYNDFVVVEEKETN